MSEQAIRELMCHVGRQMHSAGLVEGTAGNLSARLSEERILTTPSGLAKGELLPEQIIVVNLNGQRVDTPTEANAHLRPTSELMLHLECYKVRPDVQAVVHAHPPHIVAMTIAGYDLGQVMVPEMVILLGIVPTLPYTTPGTPEGRDAVGATVREHDAMVLAYHGSLTVGNNLSEAYRRLESLEHTARILTLVQQLGGAKGGLNREQVEALIAIRTRLGRMRPGDEERFFARVAPISDAG